MTMQRRHYNLIAEIIRQAFVQEPQPITREELADRFATRLRHTNPQFNTDRFLRACGVTD